MKRKTITATVFSVTGVLALSKAAGFLRQMLCAQVYGTSAATDLVTISQGFIGNLQFLLAQSVLTAFVVVYTGQREKDEREAARFASAAARILLSAAAVLALLVLFAAPMIARLLAPSYSTELHAQLTRYLRLFAPLLLPIMSIALCTSLLHTQKRFVPGEMVHLNQSLVTMLLVVTLHRFLGIRALVIAFPVSMLLNAVYTFVLARGSFSGRRASLRECDALGAFYRMLLPLLLGYSLVYVNQLVDKILISSLPAGSVTALAYAATVNNLAAAFITALASVFFPYITECITRGDTARTAALTVWTTRALLTLFVPVSLLLTLCAREIVTVLFARGAFGAESVTVCSRALQGYAPMLVPLVLREVFSRLLYGCGDTRRPMYFSSVSILCNIALSVALCPRYGVFGVAIASSVSVAVCALCDLFWASRAQGLPLGDLFKTLACLLPVAILCALAARWCLVLFADAAALWRLLGTAAVSLGVYALVLLPLLLRLRREAKALLREKSE